jgi:hypothetical protein
VNGIIDPDRDNVYYYYLCRGLSRVEGRGSTKAGIEGKNRQERIVIVRWRMGIHMDVVKKRA